MVADTVSKLAVLIDADNARYSNMHCLLAEIAKYGTAHTKRAYGDWSSPNLTRWKDQLLEHSIEPIQQFAYTYGKNSTDSAMIIDAMDLLYTRRYDGFCLVSSDSDFTRLAARIRESGLVVYGFGEQKTPKPFVAACDKFIYTENLVHLDKLEPHATNIRAPEHPLPVKKVPNEEQWVTQLRTSVEAASDNDGWASLSQVSSQLIKKYPDFDFHGYDKLSDLIAASPLFETSHRTHPHKSSTEIYVRDMRRKSK
ncbi:hypothetical protein CBS147346_3537 [Aspergillus niger]|nr:hypothetical protein CBS147346_3537 [Aspergillus niger]